MVTRLHLNKNLGLIAIVLLLCLCLIADSVILWSQISTSARANPPVLHNITIGVVRCPRSVTVGWTLGHNWNAVTNVVPCTQGRATAVWVNLLWPDGRRNAVCLDLARELC